MRQSMSEILKKVSNLQNQNDRVNELRNNDNIALRFLLKMAFDKNLAWELPAGDPPVERIEADNAEMSLYAEVPKLYRFHRGQYPNMSKIKREELFIGMLTYLTQDDIALMCAVKDKRVHKLFENINPVLINEAFPGIFNDIEVISVESPKEVKKQPRIGGKFAKKEKVVG